MKTSESALVREVMAQDSEENSIYVGDQGLGVYRTVQTAEDLNYKVVLRVKKGTAKRLWKSASTKKPLASGTEHNVTWKPRERTQVDPDLPCDPIKGRLIYVRIQRNGFRPIDVYLFTTLLSHVEYPLEDICELYRLRWRVEIVLSVLQPFRKLCKTDKKIDLRKVKTTLEMEQFEVKSAEIFKKELVAGLLCYNLIRAFMVFAAIKANIEVCRLSFSNCWRRTRKLFVRDVPAWVIEKGKVVDYLLDRLVKCTLPNQPDKVKHEPRKVRRKPAVFPQLRGTRENARKEVLQALAA